MSVGQVGGIDVLQNDSDPDAQLLTATQVTQPSHGAVVCDLNGGCTYTAETGYVGSDSFTYAATDPGGLTAAPATVAVTVQGRAAQTATVAGDDTTSTKAGVAVAIPVLTNDTGPGTLSPGTPTVPTHGTATCSSTSCTYTPEAGFTGYDAFTYTLTSSTGTDTALVNITVIPAAATLTPIASGVAAAGGTSVTEGQDALWHFGSVPSAGVPAEGVSALGPIAATATLTPRHTVSSGSLTLAHGWSETGGDGGNVQITAGPDALLGDAVSDPLPVPQPAISQGTGGDGHVPILVGSKVFAFFHHSNPTQVSCIDRSTGALCPGYPHAVDAATGNIPGPAVVVGQKIYTHLYPRYAATQQGGVYLYCWDAATDETCGVHVLGRIYSAGYGYGSPPLQIGNRLYVAAGDGNLYCAELPSIAPCPTIRQGLASFNDYDAVAHGTRFYTSASGTGLTACADVATGTTCAGWPSPKSLGNLFDVINRHDATGAITGVCGVAESSIVCLDDDGTSHPFSASAFPVSDSYYSGTQESELGTRTLVGRNGGGVGCWDWVTMAGCTGGQYSSAGILSVDVRGAGLPRSYGITFDGACSVALGDDARVFTIDGTAGISPCTSLTSGIAPRVVDLRSQRCDGSVGSATWVRARVQGAVLTGDSADFTSFTVTVKDAKTGAILAEHDLVGTDGTLDLSGISPVDHPSLTIDARAQSVSGNPAWADGVAPRVGLEWKADPSPGCFRTTSISPCQPKGTIGISVAVPAAPPETDPGPTPEKASAHAAGAHAADAGEPATATLSLVPPPSCACSGNYQPVDPIRLVDTRATGQHLRRDGVLDLQVLGVGGVPAAGVAAVVVNVTEASSTDGGYLTVWPGGTPRPVVSTVNFETGQIRYALETIKPGPDGTVSFYNLRGVTDVVADLQGYYLDGTTQACGGSYTAVGPTRILDTRVSHDPLAAAVARDVPVVGQAGVPATATGVAINVTVDATQAEGFLSVYPTGADQPTISNLNFRKGQTVANLAKVRLGRDGKLTVFSNAATQLVLDVQGYFEPGGPNGQRYISLTPARLVDTRIPLGVPAPIGSGLVATVQGAGKGGVPATGATAVLVHLTAVQPSQTGYFTAYPGGTRPLASSVNFRPREDASNLALVALGPDGTFDVYNFVGSTGLVVDVVGYYEPSPPVATA